MSTGWGSPGSGAPHSAAISGVVSMATNAQSRRGCPTGPTTILPGAVPDRPPQCSA